MKRSAPSAIAVALIAFALAAADPDKTHIMTTVSPRKLADSIHAVLAGDRESYARLIVQRLAFDTRQIPVHERWREENALPTHAQFLRTTAESIQKKGAEFSYTLRSLWPINPNNGPQTQAELEGLEFVRNRPGTNFYTRELLGGRSYFTAVYPDVAILPSCVECHNQHPASPRRDFKEQEVMGALIIRVPLEF